MLQEQTCLTVMKSAVIFCVLTNKAYLRIRVLNESLVNLRSQAMMVHTFNPSIWEAEADGSL